MVFVSVTSLGDFVRWWADQMSAQMSALTGEVVSRRLPARLRDAIRAFQARRALPVLVAEADRFTLLPRAEGGETRFVTASPEGIGALAGTSFRKRHFRKHRTNIRLVLPGLPVLRRVVRIPASAKGEAASLIGYELDRLTPFRREDVLWSLDALPPFRPAEAAFLLSLTPRAPVEPWLDLLRQGGLEAAGIAADPAPGAPAIRLKRAKDTSRARPALLAALAAIALIAAPFAWQEAAMNRLDARIDDLAPARRVAEELRARLDALGSGAALLDREASRIGSPLAILAGVTEALPDDTWLESFALKDGQLTLEGQSGAAARLIGLLGHAGTLRDPGFAGPLLRLPDSRGESFTIHAQTGHAS